MLKAEYRKHILNFNFPAGTSRGVLQNKPSWIIRVSDKNCEISGFGEVSIIPGLSIDDPDKIEDEIKKYCLLINKSEALYPIIPDSFPAVRFGFETAIADFIKGGKGLLFRSPFTNGEQSIKINGLIWMNDFDSMVEQIDEKISSGFSCIKLKIGAIDFDKEIEILRYLRERYSALNITIRVDANGAFSPDEALEKIKAISQYNIHSIEQPIKQGLISEMEKICRKAKVPVALDEELIGISRYENKERIISAIRPQYIILKPSLLGGFHSSEEWISIADKYKTQWWVTSALEGSIGLNAISQWTFTLNSEMYQGLGTGKLFSNNFTSSLLIKNGTLLFDPKIESDWDKIFDIEK